MTTVCARCLLLKQQVSPLKDGELSHGLCREHELETLVAGGMATIAESEELAAIRADYVELSVRVPGHVADRLRALGAVLEREAGRPADLRLVAGLALARDLNRGDYETVPTAVYLITPKEKP
jgi:hypothetical protein